MHIADFALSTAGHFFQLKKVLCLSVAVGHIQMSGYRVLGNIILSVFFRSCHCRSRLFAGINFGLRCVPSRSTMSMSKSSRCGPKISQNQKLVKKKLAQKYDAFLASKTLIQQIPLFLAPGLSEPVDDFDVEVVSSSVENKQGQETSREKKSVARSTTLSLRPRRSSGRFLVAQLPASPSRSMILRPKWSRRWWKINKTAKLVEKIISSPRSTTLSLRPRRSSSRSLVS